MSTIEDLVHKRFSAKLNEREHINSILNLAKEKSCLIDDELAYECMSKIVNEALSLDEKDYNELTVIDAISYWAKQYVQKIQENLEKEISPKRVAVKKAPSKKGANKKTAKKKGVKSTPRKRKVVEEEGEDQTEEEGEETEWVKTPHKRFPWKDHQRGLICFLGHLCDIGYNKKEDLIDALIRTRSSNKELGLLNPENKDVENVLSTKYKNLKSEVDALLKGVEDENVINHIKESEKYLAKKEEYDLIIQIEAKRKLPVESSDMTNCIDEFNKQMMEEKNKSKMKGQQNLNTIKQQLNQQTEQINRAFEGNQMQSYIDTKKELMEAKKKYYLHQMQNNPFNQNN